MNKEILSALAKAIESFNARLSALEEDCSYGKMLINMAIENGNKKNVKSKQKRQSGTT
jgi:hypothetical protein